MKLMELSAGETVSQVPDEFLVMPLADAEEIYDVEVQVIKHFNIRRLFMKQHLRTASKRLDISGVLWQQRNDLGSKAVLAPDVGQRSDHEMGQLNDEGAFDLNVKAENGRVLDQHLGMGAFENRPDRGYHLAQLGAGFQGRVAASLKKRN